MKVNNLDIILPLLEFKENWIYEVLIMQRKKDNPDVVNNQNVRIIKSYTISCKQEILDRYDEMVNLAEGFNARVYIKLQPYDISKVGFKLMETLVQKMQNKDYSYQSLLTKALGNMSAEKKIWVVDVDFDNTTSLELNRISTIINDCYNDGSKIIAKIPTPNGLHLICKPFNTLLFMKNTDLCNKVDIKKNNPTILYSNI